MSRLQTDGARVKTSATHAEKQSDGAESGRCSLIDICTCSPPELIFPILQGTIFGPTVSFMRLLGCTSCVCGEVRGAWISTRCSEAWYRTIDSRSHGPRRRCCAVATCKFTKWQLSGYALHASASCQTLKMYSAKNRWLSGALREGNMDSRRSSAVCLVPFDSFTGLYMVSLMYAVPILDMRLSPSKYDPETACTFL